MFLLFNIIINLRFFVELSKAKMSRLDGGAAELTTKLPGILETNPEIFVIMYISSLN